MFLHSLQHRAELLTVADTDSNPLINFPQLFRWLMDGRYMHDNVKLDLSPQFLKQVMVKKLPSYIYVLWEIADWKELPFFIT